MLNISKLSCSYEKARVLTNISFKVAKGKNLCIIGPNGCGKTTLLKAIASIIPYDGDISLDGKNIMHMSRKDIAKNIALMNQITEIYFPYTVMETVSLGRYSHQKGIFSGLTSEDKDFVINCIENVGLLSQKDKMINELSGGQLQRVFLAKAFAQDPSILLLDEPTNHLDLKSQIELLEYINKWKEEKSRSVIGVIHDLNFVQNFGEKVILMNDGKLIIEGTPKEVFNNRKLGEVYGLNVKDFMIRVLEKWKE